MARTILVIGGSRSGKSDYAEALAQAWSCPRYYLATCPPCQDHDPEMQARIVAHQQRRLGLGWQTVEEPIAIERVLGTMPEDASVLIDCLTLWVSNLMFADQASALGEDQMEMRAKEVLSAIGSRDGQVIMVTGEVGCGLVPELPLARRYRDLVGRCNQVMAAGADQVAHVVCGIPHIIKGGYVR